jgi:hypothetical protein
VGKRSRRRSREHDEPVATSSYTDAEGGVLELRDSLSAGTLRQLGELPASPAASAEDLWARRTEFLFERLAVRWTIAGLPLSGQKELLGRYRMADVDTRRWVRQTLEDHLRARHPEAAS